MDKKYETTRDEIQNIEINTDVTFLNVLKINRKFDFIQPVKELKSIQLSYYPFLLKIKLI